RSGRDRRVLPFTSRMRNNYDCIVLGIGGFGSGALYHLARRGARVLGIERFGVAHNRGSSHGETRIIRKAYFEHPDYVPLLQRAYQRWYDLEQRVGQHLFTECGCLSIGTRASEIITGVRRAAAQHHLPVEELSPADLRRRVPPLRFGEEYVGLLENDAGF